MKILITGSNGQLGQELQRIIKDGKAEIGEIKLKAGTVEVLPLDIGELDISNQQQVWDIVVDKYKPDAIINCAAYTNVDACEENIDLAYKVNSKGPENLAKAACEIRARFIHVSTDYVFSGDKSDGVPYREWDLANPQGIYGKSKLLGEQLAIKAYPKTSVVRTSWLYGYVGANFVKTILKVGKERGSLKVVNDQLGNPTNANDLAYHLIKLIEAEAGGIYHCTGEGICSWYDFASEFIRLSGIACILEPCSTDDFPRPAKRPAFSGLDNMVLRNTVGNEMRDWKVAIKDYMTYYNTESGEIER